MNKMKAYIKPEDFYNEIYRIIGDTTPLKVDCGKLCGGACCAVTDEITGMYLFPLENEMYKKMPSWGKIYDTDFSYGNEDVDLFTCTGKCRRSLRPLSCRIFPLVPYAHPGEELTVKMDIRGRGMCPLASAMKIDDLDKEFVKRVTAAMKLCMINSKTREFIYALTDSLDELEGII